jgi:hypothetical protein
MGLFRKIIDPYNTMGGQPARQPRKAAPRLPASVDDGGLSGVPLEDVARAHHLTLEAAARFRDAWNEASRHGSRTARGGRAMDDLADIDADASNWQHW